MNRARRVALAALGTALGGCAVTPSDPQEADSPVGYYACTGTNDPSLGATGFVELRDDGTCDAELAVTANEHTDPSMRDALVDASTSPLRPTGRWREGDAGTIELTADESTRVPELVLYRGRDRSLDLPGPCLSICFVWARVSR